MSSVHIKRRFFIVRRLRKWLYALFKEEEELEEQATGWHRAIAVMPCLICAKPVMPDSVFCRYCGAATQHTTGAQKLIMNEPTIRLPKPPLRAHVLTNQIEAAHIPGEPFSRMHAYNKLKRQGQV